MAGLSCRDGSTTSFPSKFYASESSPWHQPCYRFIHHPATREALLINFPVTITLYSDLLYKGQTKTTIPGRSINSHQDVLCQYHITSSKEENPALPVAAKQNFMPLPKAREKQTSTSSLSASKRYRR